MKLLPLALVLLAGGLVGWWTGGTPASLPPPPSAGPDSPNSKTRFNVISPEARLRVQQVRQARTAAERLRQVVILATNLPLAEFPRWFEGNYLRFLDSGTEDVFYQILCDRWLAAEPAEGARWLLEHRKGSAAKALASWVQADETAAIAWVKSLPASRRQETVGALISAVGTRSVAAALHLLDELRAPSLDLQGVVGKLALQDREAVLGYAGATSGNLRRSLLIEVAGAWMERDLRWVVALLQREGLGPETFEQLANTTHYGSAGLTLLNQAAFLPKGWLEQLSDLRMLTQGCELEWLQTKTGKHGLSKQVLQKLQLQAAAMPWWYNDKRAAGRKLVEQGDWLPLQARAKIAETLALRWKDDPAAARHWVDGLQGELRAAGEKGLAGLQAEIARNQQEKQLKSPAEVIRSLESETTTGLPRSTIDWNPAETADAVKLTATLAPAAAARVLNSIREDDDGLPRPVLGAILNRAMSAPPGDGDHQQREQTRAACRLAAGWAISEPRQAAAWVESLPAGEARLWAAKNVALQWNQYSTSEPRAWAAKLPEAERNAVLVSLDKSP